MASARNHRADYQRRNQLARQRGFRSYGEQRRYERRPETLEQHTRLPELAREARGKALGVIDLAREDHISPEEAAERLGVRMSTVRWWASESLGQTRQGRTGLTRRSALRLTPVVLADSNRTEFVAARGWKHEEAKRIFAIQWDVAHGRATSEDLDWLRGRKVGGRPVADTVEQLHEIARRGELDPQEAYRALVA